MDAILSLPPTLPHHDPARLEPLPHRVIAEWPLGTFLENLAVLDDQSIVVSVLSEGRLDRVTLAGERSVFFQFQAPVTGLALLDGHLYAAVGEPGRETAHLWRLDPTSGAGEPWMPIHGATFANAVTPFDEGRLLIAESWAGRLLLVDPLRRTTEVWLQDERLTRAPAIDLLPGANGVKRFHDSVTVSSNGRALLLAAAVHPDGSAGELHLLARHLRVDDLAFDIEGNMYLCTHIGHSLDRLSRDGERIGIGGVDQGMAGSTACAFGRRGAERSALYVTTTGGIVAPPGGVLQPARLVRIEVGIAGYLLTANERKSPQ